MKTFNSIKSLTKKVINSNRLLILCLSLATFGVNNAWGNYDYTATVKLTAQPTGGGTVYIDDAQITSLEKKGSKSEKDSFSESFKIKAQPNTGYSWAGWTGSEAYDAQSVTVTVSGNKDNKTPQKSYTANFKAYQYTVTFDAGANSEATPTSKSVTFDGTYGSLATTTRASLEGWYTDKTGGSKVETTTTVTTANSHTLYARYNYYAKATSLAVSNVEGDAGGGTYISINGGTPSGSSSYRETEDSSVKTIGSYNENPTTASYFAAQAKTGFKFMGWYSDKEHTQLVSSNAVYQPTITVKSNNSSSPTTLSLYAYFEVQWPTYYGKAYSYSTESKTGYTWISMRGTVFDGNFTSDVSDNSHQEGKFASAPTFPCVFYASPKDGYAFAGWYDNANCTGTPLSTSTANWCNYNENLIATSTEENNPTTIHRYAKFAPVMVNAATAQTVNFTTQTQTQTATLTFPVTNADAKADFNEPTVTSGDAGWTVKEWNYANNTVTVTLSFTATENTTTRGEHTATVTLTAKSNNSATGAVTANVQMTPVYTCTIADKYLVDDNAIDLNTLWTSTSNGAKHYSIVSFTESGINNDGATTPTLNGTTLSLGQAGTIKLKLTQDAGTSSVAGAEQTKTVTINKNDNHISINGSQDSYQASIYMEAQQAINLTATNTDYAGSPITATQTAGNTIAVLNAAQNQVTSNHNLGDATWTVSQPENYKYKAANASFTIHVVKEAEATDCYVLEDNSEHKFTTGGLDFNGHFDTPLAINGPACQLTFEAKKDKAGANQFVAQYSIDNGNNWIDVNMPDLSDSYQKPFGPFNIPDNATHIRFGAKTGGTLSKYYRNVRVTRKTYLTAADVTVDKKEDNNSIYPGEEGVGVLTINYSLANGEYLKVVWDNPKFTIDGKTTAQGAINLGDKGCSSNVANLRIGYTSIEAGNDTAHVVVYNNVYRTTATIIGKTIKREQEIHWNTDIILLGHREEHAAQTTSIPGNIITYTSSNPDVIKVINDANGQPTILEAWKEGTVNITAFSAGNEEFNDTYNTKEITVTDKDVQSIIWDQSLMGLKLGDKPIPLNARATQPDSLGCITASTRPITYSSQNEGIVRITNTNQLEIVGPGVTIITATQAGGMDADGHDFIAVTAEKKVVVRDPNAPCETYIYTQDSEVEFDLGWNAASHKTKTYEINFNGQEPGYVNFDYKGKIHTVWPVDYYTGTLSIEQYVSGQWVSVQNFGKPGTNGYTNTGNLELNRKATKIRVKANDGMGYMYFKDCQVTLARYLEGSKLNNFDTKVGSPVSQDLVISYSNISGPLTFSLPENSHFAISNTSLDGECGGHGSTTIRVTYTPTQAAVGEETTLTLADDIQKTHITLIGNATVTPLHIQWDGEQTNSCYTINQLTLSAKALTDLNVEVADMIYYTRGEKSTTGTLNNNIVTFEKAGVIYLSAQTKNDARFSPATPVIKSWTVSKTPTKVTTNPTISGDVISGTDIASLILNGGAAQNIVNNQAVEGTFAVTAGDLVNVGQQTLTITFTPDNTDMYESCTTTISVNVVQREATAEEVGTPSAASITYGNAINTSVLSGNGSLAGTWSWMDEDANKATPNVGTVDNLNVVFTPNDGNVKPVDATVSLTITKADAQLTWTTAPANVEISEAVTYVATSNHSESAITYSITAGGEYATIDATTGVLTMQKAGTITVQAAQAATDNYNAATITTTTTITGQLENKFTNADGDNDWENPNNWTNGVPTEENPDVIIAGEVIIDEPIFVGGLTIEVNGKVTVVDNGSLNVYGTSADRDTYGNLFIKNGGDVTIATEGNVRVNDFVIESSIGTNGTSQSGQITNADRVLYVNGAYIDINLDPTGKADDTQWYGFTVPFPVDVHNGVARKEGDTFRKLTYNNEYVIAEYDMNQRLNSGKGWKYITTLQLQPGRFYYITFDGDYNTYSFKAATNTITTSYTTDLTTNGTGANANWNAVGNSALRHVTASYGTTDNETETFVQVYQNGLSQYQTVRTSDATFVVGCPFFVQAKTSTVLKLTDADNDPVDNTYAPLRKATMANRSIKMVINPENGGYSDQVYMRTTTDVKSEYIIGRDLAKAGVGTATVQMWINAYGQKLSVNETEIVGEEAIFPLGIYAPKAGGYRLTIDETTTPTYLMENGIVIWDFANGSYVVDLSKGTNNDYSIVRTAPNTPGEATDIYSAQQNNQSINKVIFRNKMYIINNAHTYDAQGQTIR